MMNKYFVGDGHYIFENVLVMQFVPRNMKANIRARITSSFLCVLEGGYRYTMTDEVFDVRRGRIVYIPQGAKYSYSVLDKNTRCIQVEFDLYRTVGETRHAVRFFDRPTVLDGGEEAEQLFEALAGCYFKDRFMTFSVLYRLLALFFGNMNVANMGGTAGSKIHPALAYINQHLSEKISIPELAALCDVSESHFRRMFKSYTGRSPVRYRNWQLMERACRMLGSGVMNVGEVATALGFSDIYTFSQAFKREIGVSPKQYVPRRSE